ncbi:SGNH/GDSL hydrolase family protein [Sinomicrobium soli]|uniref:SGNH/GDSL hydrolase family protein n=1 Tax=Sinomicrobium sp. N-1-3-6 TaxID=2219864 RepID=UPI000DCB4D5D|nr:SGNH/GDSL hydrolase family protein [Sinomicrobium sp. N-1-3-6]RAV27420.1 lysophospholipase [Sinomicrobium sp. N-1-3-6]
MKTDIRSTDRRNFIKSASLASAGLLGFQGVQAIGAMENTSRGTSPLSLPEKLTVVFQGDSITDAGRDRKYYYPNESRGMGLGYVFNAVSNMMAAHPGTEWTIYNRGISGNKVYQLSDRWNDDCLQLQPDVLSILIGVNDFWHTLNGNYDGTAAVYERDLRALLDRTRKEFPDVKLIIGQPFAVDGGTAITDTWFPGFKAYREAAHRVAEDYNAVWVPYQEIFDGALKSAPASYWCPDGVHPSIPGAYLMAEAWIKGFESLF